MQQYDPNGGKSWMGSLDSPMAMEYASYIGKRENFNTDQNVPPGSAGEAEWREWWLALPVAIVKAERQWRENYDQTQNKIVGELEKVDVEEIRAKFTQSLIEHNVESPEKVQAFQEMLKAASVPNVDSVMRIALAQQRMAKNSLELFADLNPAKYGYDSPDFDSLEDKPALQQICRNHWQEYLDYKFNLPKPIWPPEPQDNGMWQAVKDYEQELGRTARPFQLYIQFVDWPSDYKWVISDSHLVLGTDYKTSKRGEYQELIREVIGKLV